MSHRSDGQVTRQRLIEAASSLFAEKGFRKTTIKEICEESGANIAAVNYHFGDKAGLYREVWQVAYNAAVTRYPFATERFTSERGTAERGTAERGTAERGTAERGDRPEEELRTHIYSLVHRISGLDPNGLIERLHAQERQRSTGLIDTTLHTVRKPARNHLRGSVAAILNVAATDPLVDWCEAVILAQVRAINPSVRQTIPVFVERSLEVDFIEQYAEHVVQFTLAALKGLRHG
jgi:TetR/AcrR family transcriptional regulator, regulator of cefoperazone and chloramphenicol sensitivity